MFWICFLFVSVPLIQLNVLAAEAYGGGIRSWNSRDFHLQRQPATYNVAPKHNAVTQPIHSLPRPLPKPIQVPMHDQELTTPAATPEVVHIENQAKEAYKEPAGRSYFQPRPQRFNFQKRPAISSSVAVTPAPVVITPRPVIVTTEAAPIAVDPQPPAIEPERVAIVPEPPAVVVAPPPIAIALERTPISVEPPTIAHENVEFIPEPTPPVSLPVEAEEPISSEDIEIITHASPAPPSTRPLLRNSFMSRPVPRPLNIHRDNPSQPEILPSAAPITSVTIVKNEAKQLPEEPASSLTEATTVIETSSPVVDLVSKIVPSIETINDEESEDIKIMAPVVTSTLRTRTVTQPTTLIVEHNKPVSGSPPPRPDLRRRRPLSKRPVVQPSPPILNPPRVTARPVSTPASLKPIPLVTPTKPPTYSTSRIPSPRTNLEANSLLMDYQCERDNGYYRVSNECDSYVECKSFVPMMSTCPDGLHFNPRAVWPEYPCSYPSEVQCESDSIRQKSQPTAECPSQFGVFLISESDCSKYIICQKGRATVMSCPSGLVFDTVKGTCDWPENVPSCSPDVFRGFTCPAPSLEEDGSLSDMIYKYRYNQSCKEYVACYRGHPRLLKCDPGLSFDEESQYCIDSDYVPNCKA